MGPTRRGNGRLVACVLVAGAAMLGLGLVGVVAGPDVAPTAAAPSSLPAITVAVQTVPNDKVAVSSLSRLVSPTLEADLVMPAVRIERRLGETTSHYIGPLIVEADGRPILRTELVNNSALSLDVPRGTRSLRFLAPDHLPLDAALPLPHRNKNQNKVATVVLMPTASLRFALVGLAADTEARCKVELHSAMHHGRGQWHGSELATGLVLPFVPGVTMQWSLTLDDGPRHWRWSGSEPMLHADEQRDVTLDVAAVVLRRYRLVGVSTTLRDLLRVWRRWPEHGELQHEQVTFGPDGYCELMPCAVADWRCEGVTLHAEPQADETWVDARGALLAVGLLGKDGEETTSKLFDADGRELAGPRALHVVVRERLAAATRIGARFADAIAIAPDRLPVDRDVVWLPSSAAGRPGRVRLRIDGKAPEPSQSAHYAVAIRDGDTLLAYHRPLAEGLEIALPSRQNLTLQWRVGSGDGAVLVRGLQVGVDELREVTTTWPTSRRWEGSVEDFAAMPEAQRWHKIGWGEPMAWQPFGQGFERLAAEGRFELVLPADAPLPTAWTLFWGQTRVAATIASCDIERNTFRVQPQNDVAWVQPVVDLPPPWTLLAIDPMRRLPSFLGSHNNQHAVPVAAGQAVHGVALRDNKAIAWFTIDGRTPTPRVGVSPGCTIEVRAAFAVEEKWVCLVGPAGQWDVGLQLGRGQSRSLFVPEGTRAIAVFDPDRLEAPPLEHALPTGRTFVVE